MKKLLAILGVIGLTATTASTVVACGPKEESLSGLSADQLQTKLNKDVKDFREYRESLKDPQNPSEEEMKKAISMILDIYCFYAKVFLETKYIVVNPADPTNPEFATEIREAVDEQEYQLWLNDIIVLVDSVSGENAPPIIPKNYKEILGNYKKELDKKLKTEE